MAEESSKFQQEENVRQYFNLIASDYSKRYSANRPFHQYFFIQRLEIAATGLDIEGKTILDIGAGTGALYDFLKEKGLKCHYYACDLSAEMLQQSHIPPNHYHIGSIETLDFPVHQFDYIFLLGVTSYLTHQQLQQHLLFISQNLSPNGTAIISFTNQKAIDFQFRKILKIILPRNWQKEKVLQQGFELNAYQEKDLSFILPNTLDASKPVYFNFSNTLLNHLIPKFSVALAKWLEKRFGNGWLRFYLASDFLVKCQLAVGSWQSTVHRPLSTLLQFSYYFPPIKSIGTLRNYNIYREWIKYFKTVEVITTSNRHRLQQEHFENIPEVHEARTLDYRWWLGRKKAEHVHLAEGKKDKPWIRFLQRLLDSFPFNILFGDGGFIYIISAYRKGKRLIKKQSVQYLYSSFRPYSDHIPPFLLKMWKPDLYWIADFRDLQVDVNVKNTFAERFQHWCNRRILAKADIITTVSEGLAQHLRFYHPNVYVLRNGIGEATSSSRQLTTFSKFTIAYTGSMFRLKRDPSLLLHALKELIEEGAIAPERVQIRYAGKDGTLWQSWIRQYQLDTVFHDLGMLPLEEANRLQCSAHINLLLTFSSPEMNGNLTGKLYEYLHAKRPILAIVNGSREPELEDIIHDLQIGSVAYHQEPARIEQVKAFLLKHYLDWQENGQLSFKMNEDKLQAYRWENMMKNFVEATLVAKEAPQIPGTP